MIFYFFILPVVFCWNHPGTLMGTGQLKKVVGLQSLQARTREQKEAIAHLLHTTPKHYKANVVTNVNIGAFGVGQGHDDWINDCEQTYRQTISYLVTSEDVYANNAIMIMKSWASNCTSFEGSNAPLEASWGLVSMLRSAELLKYMYHGWSTETETAVQKFIDRLLWKHISYKLGWYNNWSLSQIEARMQLSIFRENKSDFDWCVEEFKKHFDDFLPHDCRTSDFKRDMIHNQYALGSLIQVSELARHQGIVNLYEYNHNVLMKCLEFNAKILLGLTDIYIKDNWYIPTGWEVALHYFVRVKRMKMPYTNILTSKKRPERYVFSWGLGTITHYP